MVPSKNIIGLDLDGVILDHSMSKISIAKKLGFTINKFQTPSEIISKLLPLPVYQEFKYYLYDDPKTALSSSLIPGVGILLNKIKKLNTPIFIISRRKNNFHIPIKLLKSHNLWPEFFNEKNVFFVLNPEDKNIKAKKLNITHFVDDEPEILAKIVDVKNKYLFDPLDVFKDSTYNRIKSLKEFSRILG